MSINYMNLLPNKLVQDCSISKSVCIFTNDIMNIIFKTYMVMKECNICRFILLNLSPFSYIYPTVLLHIASNYSYSYTPHSHPQKRNQMKEQPTFTSDKTI